MSFTLRRRDTAALLFAQSPMTSPPDSFPAHPVDVAREMVGVSHSNAKRVRELLKVRPALANAAVDWGFGDWEDALGAASHVGNREIAGILLDHGARPSIFSAAMLGQLDVVQAFVKNQPGIQRTKGPHGISLLAHAKDKAVVEYLQSLGDAGAPKMPPVSAEEAAQFSGTYVYGTKAGETIDIAEKKGILVLTRSGTSPRNLFPLGGGVFHPVGAPDVRVSFSAGAMAIRDGDLVVKATAAR